MENYSFYVNAAIGLLTLAFAIRYSIFKGFMPYHKKAIGKEWEKLDSNLRILIKSLMILGSSIWYLFFVLTLSAIIIPNVLIGYDFYCIIGILVSILTFISTIPIVHKTSGNPPYIVPIIIMIWFVFQLII